MSNEVSQFWVKELLKKCFKKRDEIIFIDILAESGVTRGSNYNWPLKTQANNVIKSTTVLQPGVYEGFWLSYGSGVTWFYLMTGDAHIISSSRRPVTVAQIGSEPIRHQDPILFKIDEPTTLGIGGYSEVGGNNPLYDFTVTLRKLS